MVAIQAVWLHWPETKAVAEAITPLRFVGGCVRDAILNREVRDVDAATPLPPEQVTKLLKAAGIKAIPTGIDHGTITAVAGQRHFEITTLRRDVTTDGRHATVAYTEDWKEDAARRDFTMNALYCDPQGQVFDYFSGAADAAAGHVRFIGDARARIREDALRILRFFRFFAHYGKGAADTKGLTACGELAALIDSLSGERVAQEMLKLLVADAASEVVGLMQRHSVWEHIVPAIVKTETLAQLPQTIRKTQHTPDALIALALLLRSVSGGTAALINTIITRWKLSKAQGRRLELLCHDKWQAAEDKEWKKQIRAWGKELFIDRAVIAVCEGAEEAAALAAVKLAREWNIPEFPVTGDDLIALGVKPGKELGAKLKTLETAWEEGGYVATAKELLARLS